MCKAFLAVALLAIMAADMAMTSAQAKNITVRIENHLGAGLTLTDHCKSADDDRGVRNVADGQYQEWSFLDQSGTTVYSCSMEWHLLNEQGTFEIYNYPKDDPFCQEKCWRSIRNDGIFFYLEYKNDWVKRYDWPANSETALKVDDNHFQLSK